MMPDYQRDDGGISSANVGGCSYFRQYFSGLIAGHTVPATLGPIYYGGEYWDYAVYCSSVLATSCIGHGGAGQHGGQLAGHRYAYNLWQIINGTAAQNLASGAPVAVRTASLSGCANTGNTEGGTQMPTGTSFTWLRCTFSIPASGPAAGASLATCGPSVSGASGAGGAAQPIYSNGSAYLATGFCQTTTAAGTPVKGFRIGNSATTMSNDLSVDESSSGGSGGPLWKIQPQQLFSCMIANTSPPQNTGYVDCQNLSGGAWIWNAGQTKISYLAEGPGELGGAVPAFTVTPGMNYANGTHPVTATGGGCSPEPVISVSVSNGAIQPPPASYVTNIGNGCTSSPTFPLSGLGSGSGGAIMPIWYNTAYDMNDVGEMLYTNDGTSMGATGYDAPGFPVQRSVTLTIVN